VLSNSAISKFDSFNIVGISFSVISSPRFVNFVATNHIFACVVFNVA
jgi:hypothetical protein